MARKKRSVTLQIYMNGEIVGSLTRSSSQGLVFQYAGSWLDSAKAMPISYNLPLREERYHDDKTRAYFDNLLPDSDRIRQRLAERVHADGSDPFDLLAAIGRDCVGALQCVPEGETPPPAKSLRATPLADAEIAAMLGGLQIAPLGIDPEREFRISIAGAQEKTALLRWKGRWHRPEGTTPTTHILKPVIGKLRNGLDLSDSVENEWLCLKLAEYFGLPVAGAAVVQFDTVKCLVIERFDRRWSTDGKTLVRIPQEDLCQALGCVSSRKYESDGGPGIAAIMDFLNASDARDHDRECFFRAHLVFFLLGAIDGHAKNFSIFLGKSGFHLTPIYDVLSVFPALKRRQIEIKETKLAMCVGSNRHYRLNEIRRHHWEQTAKNCGLPKQRLIGIIDELLERVANLEKMISEWQEIVPEFPVECMVEGIVRSAERLR